MGRHPYLILNPRILRTSSRSKECCYGMHLLSNWKEAPFRQRGAGSWHLPNKRLVNSIAYSRL
jgi:hypothetical protein